MTKKQYIIIAAAVLLAVLLISQNKKAFWSESGESVPEEPGESVPPVALSSPDDQLEFDIIKVGEGPEIKNGDLATVNYVGRLKDGTVFDSSYERGVPYQFLIGAGHVIRGWDMGVLGMKVGEKRQLIIPARHGYGDTGIGNIPGGATLIFEVELLKIN
ncbi:MAG TPA: FKBP-type peptidyl-prolyl cis-trans isomerase [Candidatus Colwellbacteria bacterium]|nr:FKBP-type peptidyl-prolyl cis-trans isomerase [Candidatus Colwellbacteria bacterium]